MSRDKLVLLSGLLRLTLNEGIGLPEEIRRLLNQARVAVLRLLEDWDTDKSPYNTGGG